MNEGKMSSVDFVCALAHLNAATIQAWQEIILERLFAKDETEKHES